MARDGCVALANGPFVDDDLREGRLVQPVAHRLVCPGSWGLICRNELRKDQRVRTFIDWMVQSAGDQRDLDRLRGTTS
jgi:LysR family glycine cleavage system transcriptional activator